MPLKHDISKITRRVRAQYPENKRSVRHMRVLLEVTRQAARRTAKELKKHGVLFGAPEVQRKALLVKLAELNFRLDGYALALSDAKPTDPTPEDARRLLGFVMWKSGMPKRFRHQMPDFVTPFKIDNQFDQLDDGFFFSQLGKFMGRLEDALGDLPPVTHDIGKLVEIVRSMYTPKRRTARHLAVLLAATRKTAARSREALKARDVGSGVPEDQRKQLLRELDDLLVRLDGYGDALLNITPADPMPDELRRLLHHVAWDKDTPTHLQHPTPDFITSFKVDNQAAFIDPFYGSVMADFIGFVARGLEAIKDVAVAVVEVVEDAAEDVLKSAAGVIPWVLGGLGVLAAGGITYAVVRRK